MAILLEHCLYLLFLLFLIPRRLFFVPLFFHCCFQCPSPLSQFLVYSRWAQRHSLISLLSLESSNLEISQMAALAGRPQRAAAGRRPQGPTMCIVGPRYAAAGGMQRRRISNNFQTNLHVSNTGGRWLEFCLVVACRREGLRVRSCQCRFPTRTEYSYYSDSDGSDSLAGWTQLDHDALTESLARRDESGLT